MGIIYSPNGENSSGFVERSPTTLRTGVALNLPFNSKGSLRGHILLVGLGRHYLLLLYKVIFKIQFIFKQESDEVMSDDLFLVCSKIQNKF